MKLCAKVNAPNGFFEYIVPDIVFQELLKTAIRSITVDDHWYLSVYNDVSHAISSGEYISAKDHFERFGYLENRMPHGIAVDEEFYLKNNQDVADAVKQKIFDSAQAHFEAEGYREGRMPSASFSLFKSNPQAAAR